MGKVVEYLIAASCILATAGELNVSTSLVDDKGVDLVFHRRDRGATLAVQVEARMSTSKRVRSQGVVAFVRPRRSSRARTWTCCSCAVDVERGAVLVAWLVPSPVFRVRWAGGQSRPAPLLGVHEEQQQGPLDARSGWPASSWPHRSWPGSRRSRPDTEPGGRPFRRTPQPPTPAPG